MEKINEDFLAWWKVQLPPEADTEFWNKYYNTPSFNKEVREIYNGAFKAWNEQQKIIDSLQAECLKYREALEKASEQLEEVRTGDDFEVECWTIAEQCRELLKTTKEDLK